MAAAASAAGAGSARDDEDERDDTTKVSAPSAAVEFFRKLMNDPVTADLEIEVESGHKFYAHRAILAARSDELRDLLSGTVSEPRAKLSVSLGGRSARCGVPRHRQGVWMVVGLAAICCLLNP
jgi:hypothetical protein